MKRFITTIILCCLIPSLPAQAKEKVTLWHTMNNEEMKSMSAILESFRQQHPDLQLEVQYLAFSEALNKFKIAAMSGDGPDVFRSEIAWVPELAQMGVLEPVQERFSPQDRADFLDVALRYFTYKDQYWGIPQVTDTLALLYNKKWFKDKKVAVPTTMDELIKTSLALTDLKTQHYGFALIPQGYFMQPFLWSYGGDLVRESDRKVMIDSAETLAGWQAFTDLALKHKVTGEGLDFVNGYTNALTGFKDGRYAMMMNGPWAISDILSGSAFKDASNLGIALIPKGPGGDQGSPVGGHGWVMYKGSKVKDSAWKLMSFLSRPEHQLTLAKERSLLPTRKSTYDDPALKDNYIFQGFRQQLQVARNRPVIPESGLLFKDLDINLQGSLSGKKTPEQASKDVAKAWRQLLKQPL
jgi:arabinogalactan oligomer/maltooligosaccharide transport system substrate-binding protein